jgi:hypothetical protein
MGNDHKQLTFVHPNELHDYWGLVKEGLSKVRQHSSDGWMEEDVFSELRAGRSTLHIGDVNGDYAGFLILTPQQAFDCSILFIWCCYSVNPHVDVIDVFFPDLQDMARKMKARKIRFLSSRKGWEKRLSQFGFEPVQTVFSVEV